MSETHAMLLYVDSLQKDCIGSKKCIELVKTLNLANIVDVIQYHTVKDKLPSIVDGTPTLVIKANGDIYYGSDAIKQLEQLDYLKSSNNEQTNNQPPKQDPFETINSQLNKPIETATLDSTNSIETFDMNHSTNNFDNLPTDVVENEQSISAKHLNKKIKEMMKARNLSK